jgi:hypothetical protein
MSDTPTQTKKDVLSVIRRHQDKIKAFGVKKLGLFGSFVRDEQNVGIYSPPTPKPYKFAGIRGFGDKIK